MYVKCFILICVLGISYTMMTGGWREVSENDPEVHKHAKFAAKKISASINSPYHMKITNISDVKRQVVSGMNYNMTIALSPTECKKNHNMTAEEIENCPVLACRIPLSCNVIIWVRLWLEESEQTKLTKSICTPLEVDSSCQI